MSAALTLPATAAPAGSPDPLDPRALLAELRAECVRERELALAESATAMPDPVAVSRAARLLHTVAEIDAAMERLAEGRYGSCLHCGTAIPAERLRLRPFATGCVACEEQAR